MKLINCIIAGLIVTTPATSHAQESPAKPAHEQTYSYTMSIAPVEITENGFGLGLSYEKFLDKAGLLSFNIPFIITFNPSTDNINSNPRMDPMFYLQPGIKIYTNMNGEKRGKWSVGPNLVFAMGTGRTDHIFAGTAAADPYHKRQRFMMGAMGTVGVNLFVAKYLYVNYDFSLGCAYVNMYGGENTGVAPLVQTGFRIGLWK